MLELILVLAVNAGFLGIIIAVMEDGEFPGWGSMTVCVLAIALGTVAGHFLIPVMRWLLVPALGAVAGGFAISAVCGMTVKRAGIAAGILLLVQLVLRWLLSMAL